MAIGRIKVWIKGVVDPLEAMESINTFPGREIHHLQVVEFHHSVNQLLSEENELFAIYEADCSFTFDCRRCGKVVCVGCGEDHPVMVAAENGVVGTCGPCFYDIILDVPQREGPQPGPGG